MTEVERFFDKVEFSDGCWLWQGHKNNDGYGTFRAGKMTLAHRYAYGVFYGFYDRKLYVLHRCDVPSCVKPGHLFLGTQSDNIIDMWNKGRGRSYNGKKTHCKHGHQFTVQNTYMFTAIDGDRRKCKRCHADRMLVKYRKNKDEINRKSREKRKQNKALR